MSARGQQGYLNRSILPTTMLSVPIRMPRNHFHDHKAASATLYPSSDGWNFTYLPNVPTPIIRWSKKLDLAEFATFFQLVDACISTACEF